MPVKLSVSKVRDEIFLAAGREKQGDASPAAGLLGRLFHRTLASLFGEDETLHWRSAVDTVEPNPALWRGALTDHVYRRLVGPALSREPARLQHDTAGVINFWKASKAMCAWVTDLVLIGGDIGNRSPDVQLLMTPEEPLNLEFREPAWSDTVVLTGIADLVIRIPEPAAWCVVELKLGHGCREADLAQACLYQWILAGNEANAGNGGPVALVRFCPEKEEFLFQAPEIQEARDSLLRLIGRMAGVVPGHAAKSPPEPAEPRPKTDPNPYLQDFNTLIAIFSEYGKAVIPDGDPVAGPAFIRYPVRLGKGVRITAARKVAREVQHRMGLDAPPYVHISEGGVMVDIQRMDRNIVHFSEIRRQLPLLDPFIGSSKIILGVDLNNRLCFADLSEPDNVHILAAGTTASGKSEWLRCVLAGLISANTPDTLRLVLIDPKRNAFNELGGSTFLLDPDALVYPDEQPCAGVLARLADEMDKRYLLLQKAGVDTRDQFVEKTNTMMPRIVCMCDEYFDLVNRDKEERKDLETQVFRLGAKARAAGIHLIIATQQPNRRTIKGALDVNIPARVGFKMSRDIESKMVLGGKGAENLLGKGDMLFKDIGDPVRLQGPLLSPAERKSLFSA